MFGEPWPTVRASEPMLTIGPPVGARGAARPEQGGNDSPGGRERNLVRGCRGPGIGKTTAIEETDDVKLIVDGAAGQVTVDEPENLKSLSVQLHACSPEHAAVLLGELGRIEDGHAWLNIATLNAFARQPHSCTWDERFQRAMSYAQQNGWTDPTGDFVRAHIEPPT
jgi:hypothetical protein